MDQCKDCQNKIYPPTHTRINIHVLIHTQTCIQGMPQGIYSGRLPLPRSWAGTVTLKEDKAERVVCLCFLCGVSNLEH